MSKLLLIFCLFLLLCSTSVIAFDPEPYNNINLTFLLGEGEPYNNINLTFDVGEPSDIDTTPPTFDDIPNNITVEGLNTAVLTNFNASDETAFDQYFLSNETSRFKIDSVTGIFENNTVLSLNVYHINVSINDTSNNINWLTFSVTVQDTTPPTFDEIPNNITVEGLNTSVLTDFNASDETAFDQYFLSNETTRFKIDPSTGIFENNTLLSLNVYHINVSINDTSNNVNWTIFSVTVQDTTAPTFDEIPNNITVGLNTSVYTDFNASDETAFDQYFLVNETTNFRIDSVTGVFENNTVLSSPNVYHINVSVNDTSNNVNWVIFVVTVIDDVAPNFDDIPNNVSMLHNENFPFVQFNASDETGLSQYFLTNLSMPFEFATPSVGILTNTSPLTSPAFYLLNVSVNDTSNNINSVSFIVNVSLADLIAPTWDDIPLNATVILFEPFSSVLFPFIQFNASDEVELDQYYLNDSVNVPFSINPSTGVLVNNTLLDNTDNITTFNNSLTSENLSFVSAGKKTRYVSVPVSSIIRSADLDINGYLNGTYPTNIILNISLYNFLSTGFNDSTTIKNVTFPSNQNFFGGNENETVYVNIYNGSTITNGSFTLTGYLDWYITRFPTPGGTNVPSFWDYTDHRGIASNGTNLFYVGIRNFGGGNYIPQLYWDLTNLTGKTNPTDEDYYCNLTEVPKEEDHKPRGLVYLDGYIWLTTSEDYPLPHISEQVEVPNAGTKGVLWQYSTDCVFQNNWSVENYTNFTMGMGMNGTDLLISNGTNSWSAFNTSGDYLYSISVDEGEVYGIWIDETEDIFITANHSHILVHDADYNLIETFFLQQYFNQEPPEFEFPERPIYGLTQNPRQKNNFFAFFDAYFSSSGVDTANITVNQYYPLNPYLEVGTPDGTYEWNVTGNFTGTNITYNFASAINTYLSSCVADSEGYCQVPFLFHSDDGGIGGITVFNLSISYGSISSINFTEELISAFNSGTCDCEGCVINNSNCLLPLHFSSDTAGILEYSDLDIVTEFTEKIHVFDVFVNDTSNNINTTSYQITLTFVDLIAPTWDEIPNNITVGLNTSVYTDFNASDETAFDQYFLVNETTNFRIDSVTGVFENNTVLSSPNVYHINVSVNDTSNNINSTIFSVTVIDDIGPVFDDIPNNVTLEGLNVAFPFVQFNASDNFGFDQYFLSNETTNFRIDSVTGVFENNTFLTFNVYHINVSINDSSNNVNSVIFSVTIQDVIFLDGSSEDRIYEFQTTANITTNTSLIDVLDSTGRYINQSSPLSYYINLLRTNVLNDTLETLSLGLVLFNTDIRNEFYNASFNISGSVSNVVINYSAASIVIPGNLTSSEVQQTEFIFDDITYKTLNLTFGIASTKTIYVNYSSQGELRTRLGFINFTITGFDVDVENEFDFNENFSNITLAGGTLGINITLYGSIQDFEDNSTSYWSGTTPTVEQDGIGKYLFRTITSRQTTGSDTIENTDTLPHFDLRKSRQFNTISSFYSSGSCVDAGVNAIYSDRAVYLTDGTNQVSLWLSSNYDPCTHKGDGWSVTQFINISGIVTPDGDYIDVYLSGVFYQQVSIISLDKSIQPHLKLWSGHHTASNNYLTSNYKLYSLNVSGISIEMVKSNYTADNNYTSPLLFTAPTNISGAILNATLYEPAGTSLNLYLSNDNGTTWEPVANAGAHAFTSVGNLLLARFELSTTDITLAPLVQKYDVFIRPSPMSSLDIDIGSDDIKDAIYNFTLNASSTPVYYTGNDTGFNTYLNNSCNGFDPCVVPITFIASSSGIVQITNFNVTENINPVRFNTSEFDGKSQINFSSTDLTVSDIRFDYYGRKNITVVAHEGIQSSNVTLSVFYSPFNISIIPQSIDYWDIGPNIYSATQTEIVPFGNADGNGNPFFNATIRLWDHPTDIYIRYNESVNSCATTWFQGINRSDNTTLSVTLNTTSQLLVSATYEIDLPNNISTWTNLSCSASNSTLIVPYFCFNSLVTGAVKTSDWDSDCSLII